MKLICVVCLPILFMSCFAAESLQAPAQKFATITLGVFDTFGQQQSGCHVEEFTSPDDGNKVDFKDKFHDLVAEGVPFGMNYQVVVKCTGQASVGSASVSIDRTNQYVVVNAGPLHGDYYTGAAPRLSVLIDSNSRSQNSGRAWIEVLGVVINFRELDLIDLKTNVAHFYNHGLVPGRYVLLRVEGGKSTCSKLIDIHGPEARLALSSSERGCEATGLNNVDILPN